MFVRTHRPSDWNTHTHTRAQCLSRLLHSEPWKGTHLALQLIRTYGQLLERTELSRRWQGAILHALLDVFDMYFLVVFILFSGVSLEVLVCQVCQAR